MAWFEGEDLACLRGDRLVFAALSLALEQGGALLLEGPNGSGKSSLLKLLAGLLPAFSGQIRLQGADLAKEPEVLRETIAYLGHADAVKPALSVRENLEFWAALSLRPGNPDAALASVELSDIAGRPGRFLSSGQRRRLALARLLVAPAPLWLADEPTVGLDRASVARFEAMLASHRAAGGAVILSSHLPIALPGAQSLNLDDFAPDLIHPFLDEEEE